MSYSSLDNVRLNTVTDDRHFGCMRLFLELCCCWATEAPAVKAPPAFGKGAGSSSSFAFKGTHTKMVCFCSHPNRGKFDKL